jgi:hypothetical protein
LVAVNIFHGVSSFVHSVEPAAETGVKISAGLRLFPDHDNHNNSAQKKLSKQTEADSPDLIDTGAGVSSWPQEESLSTDNAGSGPEDSLSLLLFQRHNPACSLAQEATSAI